MSPWCPYVITQRKLHVHVGLFDFILRSMIRSVWFVWMYSLRASSPITSSRQIRALSSITSSRQMRASFSIMFSRQMRASSPIASIRQMRVSSSRTSSRRCGHSLLKRLVVRCGRHLLTSSHQKENADVGNSFDIEYIFRRNKNKDLTDWIHCITLCVKH